MGGISSRRRLDAVITKLRSIVSDRLDHALPTQEAWIRGRKELAVELLKVLEADE